MGQHFLLAATTIWPATARIAGGLAQLGGQVDALCPSGAAVHQSRFVNLRHAYHALSPLTSLRDALSISKPDLVIPCDDRAVQHLLRLAEQEPGTPAAEVIARSLGAPENYAAIMSRNNLMEAARELGLAVPQTIAMANKSELEPALEKIKFPAVLKADGSWGGEGVAIVHNREEARVAFRRLTQPVSLLRSIARAVRRSDMHHLTMMMTQAQPAITLQQFIPGKPATTAFACWKGEVKATIHMDVVMANGSTGPATVLKRVECTDMEAAARAIAWRFGLSGLHGLDFIRDASGTAYLLEINPRATQMSYLPLGRGRDLLAGLVEGLTAVKRMPRPAATANDLIALFPQEWMRDPASPYLKSAFHDIPWEDPGVLRAWLAAATQNKPRKKSAHDLAESARAFTEWKPSHPRV